MSLVKPDADTFPLIICKAKSSVPIVRTVKPKENARAASTNHRCLAKTGEKSGEVMKLCVNLMPLLAAAKEPMDEEEDREKDSSCKSKKEAESNNPADPSATKSEEQRNLDSDTKQPLSPRVVLPPLRETAAASECRKPKRCHTLLPPFSLSEQTNIISSGFMVKDCQRDGFVTEESDSGSWIYNPLLSKSRSAEFRLSDISLSSLDALLQTVTQKLGKDRTGNHKETWRHIHSDHLLEEQSDNSTDDKQPANIMTEKEAAVGICSVIGQRRLPPLFFASRPTLTLTMTKRKNLWTSSALH